MAQKPLFLEWQKVSDCKTGGIEASTAAQAFNYAVKMGAHIISCSFEGPGGYSYGYYAISQAPSYVTAQV